MPLPENSLISVPTFMKNILKLLKKIFFPHQVINIGHSMAPNVSMEIMVPNSFISQTEKLFNVLNVQVKMGSFLYSK